MEKEKFAFIGDSLVADFDWQSRIPFFNVINYGIPGEVAQDLLERLPTIIDELKDPQVILLTIGTNNILNEDYDFVGTLNSIITDLSNAYPETEIIVNSLFPINIPSASQEDIVRINGEIDELSRATGSVYLNMYDRFANSNTQLFQEDGVHLNKKAYHLWSRNIMEFIAFLIEDDDE